MHILIKGYVSELTNHGQLTTINESWNNSYDAVSNCLWLIWLYKSSNWNIVWKSFLLTGCNCLNTCTKSGENKKYCEYACADYSEYFKCQFECIKAGRNKCHTNCKQQLPSMKAQFI